MPSPTYPIVPELTAIKPLPQSERVSVVVVGAGVVGLSSALWLQRAGHAVTILDPEPPLAGSGYLGAASFGNACTVALGACIPVGTPGILSDVPGMLVKRASPLSIFWGDLPRLLPWLVDFLRASSQREFHRIVGVLGQLIRLAEAGHNPLFEEARATHLKRSHGCLYLYRSERSFARAQRDIDLRRREGVRMEMLDRKAVKEREPNLAPLYSNGLLFSDAYRIDDALLYAQALAALFQSKGGQFIRSISRAIESNDRGLIVQCQDGRPIEADRVVVAAGAWSRQLARTVGDRIRLDTERGYHVLFPRAGHLLNAPVCYPEHGFYMTPLGEGIRSAGTVELGGLGKPARPERTNVIEKVSRILLPGLGEAGRKWLGFRPSMPDSLPVISRSPTDPRITYAFGHGHIGLTLAGITGRLVCDLISGHAPAIDLHPLRANRF
ncbi:D-amino-acid dehydrogenase [Rhizobiaceae bacterium]|nr:D-amino-acid dehydrogenase [Rhizobiaceae bacterium]